ncbi:MAG: T9SS type A sorting domain-containing protein [Candidatus Marinimicrobia bacterium]|nr:T9SS type A sorting domain-containing protein [Candidatus Neomarinimicrobiota bacterium]
MQKLTGTRSTYYILSQILILILITLNVSAQNYFPSSFDESDKCGPYNPTLARASLLDLGNHWGYGYDSLLIDMERWSLSPYVSIDSIGSSVQGRAIWELSITGPDSNALGEKKTVYIHARTHPNEVQAWWVTDEMIKILLSETEFAQELRNSLIFHIVPMYNPDGVELEYYRQNANGVDLESNWFAPRLEPEVQVLKSRFEMLMNSTSPITMALNMHSSVDGSRFFVCHDSSGTSFEFLLQERYFIGSVRDAFSQGIQPWDYMLTWIGGNPMKYPESWFWLNHAESVMALTYEDMNNDYASAYDTTAYAILQGVPSYLFHYDISVTIDADLNRPDEITLEQNYPNPFNPATTIRYSIPSSSLVTLTILDLQGRQVATLKNKAQSEGAYEVYWNAEDDLGHAITAGVYICCLKTDNKIDTQKMVYLK